MGWVHKHSVQWMYQSRPVPVVLGRERSVTTGSARTQRCEGGEKVSQRKGQKKERGDAQTEQAVLGPDTLEPVSERNGAARGGWWRRERGH